MTFLAKSSFFDLTGIISSAFSCFSSVGGALSFACTVDACACFDFARMRFLILILVQLHVLFNKYLKVMASLQLLLLCIFG